MEYKTEDPSTRLQLPFKLGASSGPSISTMIPQVSRCGFKVKELGKADSGLR